VASVQRYRARQAATLGVRRGAPSRLGASRLLLARMLANVVLEGAIGAVPFAGDANRRNVAVLRQHFARTGIIKRAPGRQSRLPLLRPHAFDDTHNAHQRLERILIGEPDKGWRAIIDAALACTHARRCSRVVPGSCSRVFYVVRFFVAFRLLTLL
jgi:hypothetical protein